MKKTFDIKVFISSRKSCCEECHENLGRKAWITLVKDKGALCLSCADLDHLVFLPAGNAALTRRARKHSTLSALVLKWNRARKRYERQGLLVEVEALEQAEQECLADSEVRACRGERAAARRAELDQSGKGEFLSPPPHNTTACGSALGVSQSLSGRSRIMNIHPKFLNGD